MAWTLFWFAFEALALALPLGLWLAWVFLLVQPPTTGWPAWVLLGVQTLLNLLQGVSAPFTVLLSCLVQAFPLLNLWLPVTHPQVLAINLSQLAGAFDFLVRPLFLSVAAPLKGQSHWALLLTAFASKPLFDLLRTLAQAQEKEANQKKLDQQLLQRQQAMVEALAKPETKPALVAVESASGPPALLFQPGQGLRPIMETCCRKLKALKPR